LYTLATFKACLHYGSETKGVCTLHCLNAVVQCVRVHGQDVAVRRAVM